MENRLFLALSLAAVSLLPAHGAPAKSDAPVETTGHPPETPDTYAAADRSYAEAMKSLQRLQDCKKLVRQMTADIAEKEKALKAEFGGRVPHQFDDLLNNKRKRVNKQANLCLTLQEQPAKLFAQAHMAIKQIQPYSMPGVAPRKKRLDKARASYNQLIGAKQGEEPEQDQQEPQ